MPNHLFYAFQLIKIHAVKVGFPSRIEILTIKVDLLSIFTCGKYANQSCANQLPNSKKCQCIYVEHNFFTRDLPHAFQYHIEILCSIS